MSLDEIQRRWAVPPVCVPVKILGEEKDLPADLRELIGALDSDKCIEGKVLVDLCRQRSERRGSGCDVSWLCGDLPDPSTSTSRMVHRPAVQVNLFSWSNHANTDKHLDGKRREFINSWKYSNSQSFFPHNRHLSSLRSVCNRWCIRWPEATGLKVRGNAFF